MQTAAYAQTPQIVERTEINETCFAFSDSANAYHLTSPPSKSIDPGVYGVDRHERYGIILSKHGSMSHDTPFTTTSDIYDKVGADMEKFWSLGDEYAKAGRMHKRGILLHGPAGTGKTHLVYREAERVISMGGIAVILSHGWKMPFWGDIAPVLRKAFPEMPVCVVIEEIDNVGYEWEQSMLSFLDGPSQIGNCIVMATTNDINSIRPAIKDRPGRFDRSYHVGLPDARCRLGYVMELCQSLKADLDVQAIADATEGLSIAHLKEVVLSMHLYGYSMDEVISHMSSMGKDVMPNGEPAAPAGFKIKQPEMQTSAWRH